MTIGTPQDLGQNSSASTPASLAITTTQNIVAGDVILLTHYANATGANISTLVDSGGVNVYRLLFTIVSAAPVAEVWACYNATALASGGTITATFGGSVLRQAVNAMRLPGCLRFDSHTGNSETSTATSSPNTVVNNYGAVNEIILGMFMSGGGSGGGTNPGAFTPGTGFTALNSTVGVQATIYTQYQIVSASAYTTNINNAGAWTASVLHRGLSVGILGACSC